MEGPEIQFAEAVIDNGKYGTRTVRFETGRLAQQAAGTVAAYLDNDTMLLPAVVADSNIVSLSRYAATVPAACWARRPVSNRTVRVPYLPLSITASANWISGPSI